MILAATTNTLWTLKPSLQVVLNTRFPQLDFWRTLTVQGSGTDSECFSVLLSIEPWEILKTLAHSEIAKHLLL